MSFKRGIFNIGLKLISLSLDVISLNARTLIYSSLLERYTPIKTIETPYKEIKFFCPGEIALWRAKTLLTKEPETIEWIDNFDKDTIFWDIGANVGCYSLYTAVKDIHVLSFEPSAINYYIINKNIEINNLENLITAYCLAFSDYSASGVLNLSDTTAGGAINLFGQRQDKVLCGDFSSRVLFRQGMIGFSIDDFISKHELPIPNYIKIDADGIEDKIINGALKTLRNKELKSILIELDSKNADHCKSVVNIIEDSGFHLIAKKHGPMFDSGEFASIHNYIFDRK
jgi:FkbM family methyltransferase